jgi:hypothetical protein
MPHLAEDQPQSSRKLRPAAVLLAAALAAAAPATADARNSAERAASPTALLDVDLSRDELGLSPRAPAERLARAALARHADRLGLSRSRGGLRLASRMRLPASTNRALPHISLNHNETVVCRRPPAGHTEKRARPYQRQPQRDACAPLTMV